MRLIINADDLGMSEGVNEAIFALMAKGFVTSASALANAPALDTALRTAREFPSCSFGVHLNLTQFRPITSKGRLAPFVNECGEFQHSSLRRAAVPAVSRAIQEEWCAQVDKIRSHAIEPSHFDSHHHVHFHPFLLPPLVRTQQEHGVRRIRRGKNIGQPSFRGDRTRLPAPVLALQRAAWRFGVQTASGARMADGFTSLMEFHDLHRAGAFNAPLWKETRKNWIVELMVHPGHPNYAAETAILESGWLDEIGIPRMSYLEL